MNTLNRESTSRSLAMCFFLRPLVALSFATTCALAPADNVAAAPIQWAIAPLVERPAEPDAIRLYPGVAPGSEGAGQREIWTQTSTGREIRNVTDPVLLPFLPAPGKSNGTAVIVAPGGGFRSLAIENEGIELARRLAGEGIAAFVLKYRLTATPEDPAAFQAEMQKIIAGVRPSGKPIPVPAVALADCLRALQLVRERAGNWGVRPDRVGMLGFSAGAMLTLQLSTDINPASRPAFAGMIYGPVVHHALPAGVPPAFIALAADDFLFANGDYGLVGAWQRTGSPVEFHLYGNGGHGFGMFKRSTTSDLWYGQFRAWMQMRGLVPAQAQPQA